MATILSQTTTYAYLQVQVDDFLPSEAVTITNSVTLTALFLTEPMTAQDTDLIGTLPDLVVAATHTPGLFSPGKVMTYSVTYANQGYMDAEDVVLSTVLPTDTQYVGGGWSSSDGRVFTYTVGSLDALESGGGILFIVSYPLAEPQQISQTEYATPFVITGYGGNGGDANPDDNEFLALVGVPDLVIVDFSVEPLPVRPNTPLTFTVVLENQGTGWALNPVNNAGFFLDIYLAPVASYPFDRYGELYEKPAPIAPGARRTVTLNHSGFTVAQIESTTGFYAKVDAYDKNSYGLVPEYNEMNNVAGPLSLADYQYEVYLPLVVR
jgi:uncharacterized repeat protein (TIGR01451 family)